MTIHYSNDPMIAASQRFDHYSSESRTFTRCAVNALSINNQGAFRYFRRKAREAAAECRRALAVRRGERGFLDAEALVAARFAGVAEAGNADYGFGLSSRRTGEDRHIPNPVPVVVIYECECGVKCRTARALLEHVNMEHVSAHQSAAA